MSSCVRVLLFPGTPAGSRSFSGGDADCLRLSSSSFCALCEFSVVFPGREVAESRSKRAEEPSLWPSTGFPGWPNDFGNIISTSDVPDQSITLRNGSDAKRYGTKTARQLD